jgi:hypothetical protein
VIRNRSYLLISAVAIVVGLVACAEPKATDMVGTWNLTNDSRRYLPADMTSLSPRLVLGADGRLSATDLPGMFHGSLDVVERYSGTGSWSVIRKDGRQKLQLNFDGAYGTQFDIANDGGAWKLHDFLGDPDEHRRLEYAKAGSS